GRSRLGRQRTLALQLRLAALHLDRRGHHRGAEEHHRRPRHPAPAEVTLPHRLEPNPYRPPLVAGEKETLAALLDYHRAIVVHKLEGVSEGDARRRMVPSGTSLLGIVQHLANVELSWFAAIFAGVEADLREDSWAIGANETVASVCARYEAACEQARSVTAGAGLDDVAV